MFNHWVGRIIPMTRTQDVQWLDQEQQRAWRAFLVGSTLLMDRLDRQLREQHGLSLPEYEILVRLSEAPSFGQPIIAFDAASRGAIAYSELAKEVSDGSHRAA